MDNEVGIISDFIDLSATGTQAEAFLGQLKRINDAYDVLSSKSISLGGLSSSKEITAQIKQLQAELASLQKQKQEILSSDIAAAKLEQAQANAKLAQIKLLAEEEKKAADIRKRNAADDIVLNKMIAEEEREIARQRIVATQEQAKADEEAAQHRRDLATNEYERLSLQPGAPALGQQQIPTQPAVVVPVAALTEIEKTAAALNEEKAALAGLQAEQKQLTVDFEAGTISAGQYEKELARLTVAQVECKQTIASFNVELNNLVKSNAAATGSLEEQRAELILLNQQYAALSATEQAAAEGVALRTQITANTESLKLQEAELGNAQRNVGNYGSGFEKVGKQLDKFTNVSTIASTTLSRLFRTFIGFAVISVVIDLFRSFGTVISDAIERVRAPLGSLNDTLKKNQEAVAGAQQAYTSAVQAVDNLKEHIRLSKEGFIDQDKVVKEYNETVGKTVGASNSLADVEQKLISQGDNYIKFTLYKAAATVALGKAADQAFLAEQARQKQAQEFASAGTAAKGGVTAFDDLGQAAPGAAQATIKRQEQAAEEAKQRAIKEAEDQEAALEKIAKDFNDKAKGFGLNFLPDPDSKGVKESTEKVKNFLAKTSDEILKYQIQLENELSQAQELGFATRLAFAKDAYEKQNFLDAKDRQEKIAAARLKLNDALQAANETAAISTKGLTNTQSQAYKNAIEKQSVAAGNAQREFNATISTINDAFRQHEVVETDKYYESLQLIRGQSEQKRRDEEKRDRDAAEEILQKQEEFRQKREEDNKKNRDSNLSFSQDTDIIRLNRQYAQGLISTEQYQLKKFEIEKEYSLKSQNNAIADAQKVIDEVKSTGVQVVEAQLKIEDLKKKVSDETTQHLLDNQEKLRAAEKETAKQIVSAIGELGDDVFDARKNQIQGEIDQLNLQKEKQIEVVNASVASEQDKAAQIAIINARADAQQQALEKRQKEQDIKKAEFDKVIAISQIAIQTAQSVQSLEVKVAQATAEAALLAGNPATAAFAGIASASAAAIASQIPLIIAQGVIAAGLVAARPIPRYRHGTENHPGGEFLAGDGGRPEFVLLPSGHGFTTPAQDTMYSAPAGTKVFPDANNLPEEIIRMAMRPMRERPLYDGNNASMEMMSREIRQLRSVVANKRENYISLRKGEWEYSVKEANRWTHYKNGIV